MFGLGPQRICIPSPAKAGWAEMADTGTISAVSAAPSAAAIVVGVNLESAVWQLFDGRKTVARVWERSVGRRVGREENDLLVDVRLNVPGNNGIAIGLPFGDGE